MCGIFSYLYKHNIYNKPLHLREQILKSFSKIQHRGPDNSSFINLYIWLPSYEWKELDRNKLILSFGPLANTFDLKLSL